MTLVAGGNATEALGPLGEEVDQLGLLLGVLVQQSGHVHDPNPNQSRARRTSS